MSSRSATALLSRLPLPVAQVLKRAFSASSQVERHQLAYFAAEAILKLASAARISVYMSWRGMPPPNLAQRMESLVLPSTGLWLDLLRELSKVLDEGAQGTPLLGTGRRLRQRREGWRSTAALADFAASSGVVSRDVANRALHGALGFFEFLTAYRNEVIGHGAQRPAGYYERTGPLLLQAVQEVLDEESLLGGGELAVGRATYGARGEELRREWLILQGLGGLTRAHEGEALGQTPLVAGRAYLVGGGWVAPLHPLVVYHGNELGRERVGLLNRAASRGQGPASVARVDYLDYGSGNTLEGVDAREAVRELLERIRGQDTRDSDLDQAMTMSLARYPDAPTAAGRRLGEFALDEEIGRGGMAVVYSAVQDRLEREVAVKVMLPALAQDSDARERFLREAKALAKLEHPHVVRIYSFGEDRGTLYLAMERVRGGTLADRIKREGPLSTEVALVALRQILSALEAAWAQGIVHRDLKPSNVLLDGRVGAKVADFGLVKPAGASEISALTASGTVVGTPYYASPEQLRGEQVDFRSDLYSAGTMLFEMLAGQRPFEAFSPYAIIDKHLREAFPSIRAVRPGVSESIERLIFWMTEKDRKNRPSSHQELYQALDRIEKGEPATAVVNQAGPEVTAAPEETLRRTRLRSTLPVPLVGGAVVALSIAVIAGTWLASKRASGPSAVTQTSSSAPSRVVRRSFAVLGFKNSGPSEADWMSTAIAEQLQTELAASSELRAVPGEAVARMRAELELNQVDSLSAETLERVRANLAVDLLVMGSYVALGSAGGKRLRLDIRLQDTTTAETLAPFSSSGTEDKIFELVSEAGARLRDTLNLSRLDAAQALGVRAALPLSPRAAELYAKALDRLRVFDARTAAELLQSAVEAEPSHALTHAALAEAWSVLGYDGRARQAAETASGLAGSLEREARLAIQARLAVTRQDWDQAVEKYRSLFLLNPDNVEDGLRLAEALTESGNAKSALQVISSLRELPAPTAADPRLDLAEAEAAKKTTDFERQAALARDAASKAEKIGAKVLLARAQLMEGDALIRLGQHEEGIRRCEDARKGFEFFGDRASAAEADNTVAVSLSERGGSLGVAKQYFQRALKVFETLGNARGIAKQLSNIGSVLENEGNLAEAVETHQRAVAAAREAGDPALLGQIVLNLGVAEWYSGALEPARSHYEEALRLLRDAGSEGWLLRALYNLGELHAFQGRLREAAEAYQESLDLSRKQGNPVDEAYALTGLADVAAARKDYQQARELYRKALEEFRTIGDTAQVDEVTKKLQSLP